MSKSKKKSSSFSKILSAFFLFALIAAAYMVYEYYSSAIKSNINTNERKSRYIFIKRNANYNDVINELKEKNILLDLASFEFIASSKNYKENIKPGKYYINKQMSNKELVNILRKGQQEKIILNLNNIRTKEQLAGRIASQLEPDSITIIDLLNNDKFCMENFKVTTEQILTNIIPQDYEIASWAISPEDLFKIFKNNYTNFWDNNRLKQSQKLNMTKLEVTILASIVQQEQQIHKQERPTIAGVYLNRLAKNMKLQADPTVIFALKNFETKRVTYEMLTYNSPYNTYLNTGLPPGPICVASANAIDAVLNSKKHNYIYFCAKEDLSGFHNFTASYNEHERNAKRYAQALNKKNIN